MIFRGSNMPRVMACAGSYLLSAPYPDDSGDEADEGTIAHGYAAECSVGRMSLSDIPDLEMLRTVSVYTDICQKYSKGAMIEGPENTFEIDLMGHTLHGTTDFFSWASDGILHIIDFKYGHGWVEAFMNWQLITYAILMWLKYGNGITPNRVRLTVVQPRANHPHGPVRSWEFDGDLLRNFRNQLQNQVTAAALEGAVTRTSKECRYCPALIPCHTNREASANVIDIAGTAAVSDLDGACIAHELDSIKRAMDLVTHRYVALESYALERVRTGEIVPGYTARQMPGALQWDVDPIAAGRDMGKDLARPQQPVTPTQAINQKLITEDEAALMASRKLGSFKLKREDLTFAKELIKNASR